MCGENENKFLNSLISVREELNKERNELKQAKLEGKKETYEEILSKNWQLFIEWI